MNSVIQAGWLVQMPKRRPLYDEDGKPVLDEDGNEVENEKAPYEFIISNNEYNRFYKRMKPNFHPCIAWAGSGKAIIENFELGDRILIKGICKTDWFTNKNGYRLPQYRIQVERFEHDVKCPDLPEDTSLDFEEYYADKKPAEKTKEQEAKKKDKNDHSAELESIFG